VLVHHHLGKPLLEAFLSAEDILGIPYNQLNVLDHIQFVYKPLLQYHAVHNHHTLYDLKFVLVHHHPDKPLLAVFLLEEDNLRIQCIQLSVLAQDKL
jgi:hypothetical protein